MAGNIGGGGQDGDAGFFAELVGEFLDAALPSGLDAVVDDAITDGLAQKANRELDSLFANASLNAGQQTVADEVLAAMQDEVDSSFPEADVESAANDAMPDDFEALSDLVEESVFIVDNYQDEAMALTGEEEA